MIQFTVLASDPRLEPTWPPTPAPKSLRALSFQQEGGGGNTVPWVLLSTLPLADEANYLFLLYSVSLLKK